MAETGKPSFFSTEVINGTLLSTFINSSNDFSKQLTTVLLMSSMDEIKKLLTDLISYIRANFRSIIGCLHPYPLFLYLADLPIFRTILRYFSRRPRVDTTTIAPYVPLQKMTQVELVFSEQFLGGIIQYISSTGNGQIVYNEDYSINPRNRNDLEYTKTIRYFEVNYKGMTITCDSTIAAKFGPTGMILTGSGIQVAIDGSKVRSIMDLLPQGGPTYKFLKANVDFYMSDIQKYSKDMYIYTLLGDPTQWKLGKANNYPTHEVVYALACKYPNLHIAQSCFEFELLWGVLRYSRIEIIGFTFVLQGFNQYISSTGTYWSYAPENSINTINRAIIYDNFLFSNSSQCSAITSPVFHSAAGIPTSGTSTSGTPGTKSLLLKVANHDDELFRECINTVMSSGHKQGNKIKIFDVKVQHKETTSEIPNPAYEKIQAQLALEQQNPDSKELVNELKRRLLDINQTISTKCETHQVESVFVTEKCKDFSTLYLREREKKQLCGLIETYCTNKDRLIQLGLPDKLGILLEGLPGTGKTSTIWAIATALKKNIYYVNLNTVMTNQQLTDVFRFVDNEANGGIIVFEDIDSMSDVVLQRTRDTPNGELTLGHLLNLLQGTLTKDGTMFIVTTNHLDHLDAALCRDGRFDLVIKMQLADRFQCAEIFNTFFSRKLDSSLLALLPEDSFTPAKFIFYLSRYMWSGLTDEEIIRGFTQVGL